MLRMLILVDVTGVTLGHEGIGKVIEVAEDVESLKIGESCVYRLDVRKLEDGEYCTTGRGKHFAVV